MKTAFLAFVITILLFPFSNGQSTEFLKQRKAGLLKQIGLLQDSIKRIDKEIDSLRIESLASTENDSITKIVMNFGMAVKNLPDFNSGNKYSTKKGDTLIIYNEVFKSEKFDDYYVKLVSGGYVDMKWIDQTDQLKQLKKNLVDSLNKIETLFYSKSAEEGKAKMVKAFGAANAKKILERKIWLGMTANMAVASWGRP